MITSSAEENYGNGRRPDGQKREKRTFETGKSFNRDDRKSSKNGEYKPRGNGDYKPKTGGEYKPRVNGDYKPRPNGDFRQKSNGTGQYRGGFGKGFDKDEDDTPVRKSRPRTESKPKEQPSDKMEIKSRLEKEKKAMKKKQSDNRDQKKPAKHQVKPKRSGNIDWTREYENDSYDDDDLDMYL